MGLAESQRLLARLTTDPLLRARFASDPGGVATEFGLSLDEANALALMPLDQLNAFAESLIRKRRGEVESLLPLTFRALEPTRFATEFGRHARDFVPTGIKKHRDDAVAFAGFLGQVVTNPPWLGDLARLEATSLLVHDPSQRWTFLRLNHPPHDLARAATDRTIVPKPRPTWVVWFRLSAKGRLRRTILSRPW